jgi:hypothetical protein
MSVNCRKARQEAGGRAAGSVADSPHSDDELVASGIRYLDQHHTNQPDLAAFATGAGLAESVRQACSAVTVGIPARKAR